MRAARLLSGELGRALLDVGRQAFLRVVALEELLLELPLDRERLAKGDLEPRLDRALDATHGLRGLAGRHELTRVLDHLRVEAVGVPDVVHEAPLLRVLEREGGAGRHHLDGAGLYDQASQALRSA